MQSDTAGAVARLHDPARHAATLRYRSDEALPFDADAAPLLPLLLDTTTYLDRSAGRLPRPILDLVSARRRQAYTGTTACAELAISTGLLDPSDPRTPAVVSSIRAQLDQVPLDRIIGPGPASWTEAAVLAGILARTQGLAVPKRGLTPDQECCQRGRRRELLLDALLYLTAVEHGMLLVSGNVRHMDLLLQVKPSGNVLLYRPANPVVQEAAAETSARGASAR